MPCSKYNDLAKILAELLLRLRPQCLAVVHAKLQVGLHHGDVALFPSQHPHRHKPHEFSFIDGAI